MTETISLADVRTIVAGPRDFTDQLAMNALIASAPWKIGTVLSGACGLEESVGLAMPPYARGGDGLGERYAREHGIPVERFFACWLVTAHGRRRIDKAAGPKRNRLMAELAHALIAYPTGPPSPHSGTWHMIAEAIRAGLEVWVPTERWEDVRKLEDRAARFVAP
jgi:hypothetical protein